LHSATISPCDALSRAPAAALQPRWHGVFASREPPRGALTTRQNVKTGTGGACSVSLARWHVAALASLVLGPARPREFLGRTEKPPGPGGGARGRRTRWIRVGGEVRALSIQMSGSLCPWPISCQSTGKEPLNQTNGRACLFPRLRPARATGLFETDAAGAVFRCSTSRRGSASCTGVRNHASCLQGGRVPALDRP
jgi:hypothetical protein